MEIEILSPNQKIYEGEAASITLPGKRGQFQILPDHAPLFALLDKGKIILENGKKIPIFLGIVEVLGNRVIVLIKEEKNEKS